jgi:Putative Ig domain/Immunoglobulin domain
MRLRTLLVLLAINRVGLFAAGCTGSTAARPSTPPQIVVPPASQTVTIGQTAAFSVTATGAAPLSYQWNKNGAGINGATSATYTTPPTTSADNGSQFDVAVSNSAGRVNSTTVTLTVTSASSVTISSASLPNGTVQTAYSATLRASGGTTPYTWSVASGSLPIGLNLAASGTISGTPTTAGTSSFTIQVTDSGANKALAGFTITVNNGTGGGTMPSFDRQLRGHDGGTNLYQ